MVRHRYRDLISSFFLFISIHEPLISVSKLDVIADLTTILYSSHAALAVELMSMLSLTTQWIDTDYVELLH